MVEIIGIKTEEEAKRIYAEAEKKLNEKKAEIDKWNKEEKSKKEKEKQHFIFISIVVIVPLVITISFILFSALDAWGKILLGGMSCGVFCSIYILLLNIFFKEDVEELLPKIFLKQIDERSYSCDDISYYLPQSYKYYDWCKKYGEPISVEYSNEDNWLELIFADSQDTIIRKSLYMNSFNLLEKRNLKNTKIDLINECIQIPYLD